MVGATAGTGEGEGFLATADDAGGATGASSSSARVEVPWEGGSLSSSSDEDDESGVGRMKPAEG